MLQLHRCLMENIDCDSHPYSSKIMQSIYRDLWSIKMIFLQNGIWDIHWMTQTRNLKSTLCLRLLIPKLLHDDVIKWKHFPRYWPFVRGIHRSPVNSPQKGQWHGALMFSLICAWINIWVNNREAGYLRRHRAHYDVTVMTQIFNWRNGESSDIMTRYKPQSKLQNVPSRWRHMGAMAFEIRQLDCLFNSFLV